MHTHSQLREINIASVSRGQCSHIFSAYFCQVCCPAALPPFTPWTLRLSKGLVTIMCSQCHWTLRGHRYRNLSPIQDQQSYLGCLGSCIACSVPVSGIWYTAPPHALYLNKSVMVIYILGGSDGVSMFQRRHRNTNCMSWHYYRVFFLRLRGLWCRWSVPRGRL